jgi:hypothetical protein
MPLRSLQENSRHHRQCQLSDPWRQGKSQVQVQVQIQPSADHHTISVQTTHRHRPHLHTSRRLRQEPDLPQLRDLRDNHVGRGRGYGGDLHRKNRHHRRQGGFGQGGAGARDLLQSQAGEHRGDCWNSAQGYCVEEMFCFFTMVMDMI